MTNWSDWYPWPETPKVGAYVQVEAEKWFSSGEFTTMEGRVTSATQGLGFDISPSPRGNYTVIRWRFRISPGFQKLEEIVRQPQPVEDRVDA